MNSTLLLPVTVTRLKKLRVLEVGEAIKLRAKELTVSESQAWYRAAKRLSIRISIRRMPDGLKLWRLS